MASGQRIQLEIDEAALKRLVEQKKLSVGEFRCLTTESKNHLRRLFLDLALTRGHWAAIHPRITSLQSSLLHIG